MQITESRLRGKKPTFDPVFIKRTPPLPKYNPLIALRIGNMENLWVRPNRDNVAAGSLCRTTRKLQSEGSLS